MKKNNDITRSLVVDEVTWKEAKCYARGHYSLSLSKVINSLLVDWVKSEKKKGLLNPNQGQLI